MATSHAQFGTRNIISINSTKLQKSFSFSAKLPSFTRQSTLQHRCHAGKRTDVFESLTLIQFPPATAIEVISDTVDTVWSLQYMVAGPVCSSAGPLIPLASFPAAAPPFSHAVLFRYGQDRVMQSFLGHGCTVEILEKAVETTAVTLSTLTFSTSVPSELESIFRRGSEWDEGYEFIARVGVQEGASAEDAREFLDLTQQLAMSSAFGAVQAVSGRCSTDDDDCTTSVDFMVLARFQTKQQVEAFVQCPPVAAMMSGNELSPLKTEWAAALEVMPPVNSNTGPPDSPVPKRPK